MSDIIFVNDGSVEESLTIYSKGDNDLSIIPLSPQAAHACLANNIAYRSIESFISREKLVSQRPSYTSLNNNWLDLIDNTLQSLISEFSDLGFCPARLYTMQLHGFLDEINAAYLMWDEVKSTLKPKRIFIARSELKEPAAWSRVLPQQKLVGLLLPYFAHNDGIECIFISDHKSSPSALAEPDNVGAFRRLYTYLKENLSHANRREIKLFLRFGWRRYCKSLLKSKLSPQSKAILFIGGGYDLGELAVFLREKRYRVELIEFPSEFGNSLEPDIHIKKLLCDSLACLLSKEYFLAPFPPKRNQLNDVCIAIFKRWLLEIVPRQWAIYRLARNCDLVNDYSAIVNWAYGEGENSALVDAFRKSKIPAFCFQHGGASRNSWITDYYQEYLQSDIYLLYGEGQKNIFENLDPILRDPNSKPKVIPVGSVRLDGLKVRNNKSTEGLLGRQNKKKTRILYIPTLYDHPGFTINDSCMVGVDYFSFQAEVLTIFSNYPEFQFIYKGFPGTLDIYDKNPIKDFISLNNIGNVEYKCDVAITQLMWQVDFIVIDHNQTALNEILLTNVPILLFDQGSVYPWTTDEQSRNLLGKAVEIATTVQDFKIKLDNLLRNGHIPVDRSDPCEFTIRYGIHKNDGGCLNRAGSAVIDNLS